MKAELSRAVEALDSFKVSCRCLVHALTLTTGCSHRINKLISLLQKQRDDQTQQQLAIALSVLQQKYKWNFPSEVQLLQDTGKPSEATLLPTGMMDTFKENLQQMASSLNHTQLQLDTCRTGQLKLLRQRLKTIEDQLKSSQQLCARCRQNLQQMILNAPAQSTPEIHWLQELFKVQEQRYTAYKADFQRNHEFVFSSPIIPL
ncbi:hypothetical protein Ciccas_014200, partial [Cichlidogyrus casuarinus]